MASNTGVTIKVGLAGAATARREANSTGKAIKGIGTDSETASRKVRLAEISMKGFEKTSHKLRHTIRELAGVTGLAGLAFGTGEVVKSAIEAQTAQAKLAQTMKNAGLSWRRYGKDVDETLEKQSLATGFSRGQVTDSFSNFIRTTGSVRKATKLNNIAFDVARTKGIGLAQTQSLLARVYNGSYIGLKRLGIGITPVTVAQDKLKASGQKYTAQQLARAKADDKAATSTQALRIVQQKFSGQAAAYGKTAQGSVDLLKASVEAIQEKVGAIILPYVAKGAAKLADLTKKLLENWPQISKTISTQADKVKSALSPLIDFISTHKKGVAEFAAALLGIGVGLKTVRAVGHFTGLSKVASIATGKSGLGKLVSKYGGATPVYVVNWGGKLEKSNSLPKKALNAVKTIGPATAGLTSRAALAGITGADIGAGLSGAVFGGGILLAAIHAHGNFNPHTSLRRAAQHETAPPGFGTSGVLKRVITPPNAAAVRQAASDNGQNNLAAQAILHGSIPLIVHSHTTVITKLDGKPVAKSVTHAANKALALK